jgi:hypothetical protein
LYKQVNLIANMLGALLAGLIFKGLEDQAGEITRPSPPTSGKAGGKS